VWVLLKHTIDKINSRVVQVTKKLDVVRKELAAALDAPPTEMSTEEAMDVDTEQQEKASELENTLNALKREQKQLYISIFDYFLTYLDAKLNAGADPLVDSCYIWAEGMMREIGRHVR
jgi:hypothetical protein